jgi:hypothetical protein
VQNSQYAEVSSHDRDAIVSILKQASHAKNKMLIGLRVPDTDIKQSVAVGNVWICCGDK